MDCPIGAMDVWRCPKSRWGRSSTLFLLYNVLLGAGSTIYSTMKRLLALFAIPLFFACTETDSKWPYTQEEENRRKKEMISKCISEWEGSYIELTTYIKENMNDPDSYKHIKSHHYYKDGKLYITTEFRGKNAFGGMVKETLSVVVDFNCNVIEI